MWQHIHPQVVVVVVWRGEGWWNAKNYTDARCCSLRSRAECAVAGSPQLPAHRHHSCTPAHLPLLLPRVAPTMSFRSGLKRFVSRSLLNAKRNAENVGNFQSIKRPGGGILPLWKMDDAEDLDNFALGSDKDIGGLSTCELVYDGTDQTGRFRGTITSDIPRGARLGRSGYAALRNRIGQAFASDAYDDATTLPYLLLRVRDHLAGPPAPGYDPAAPTSVMTEVEKSTLAAVQGTRASPHALPPGQSLTRIDMEHPSTDLELRMSGHIPNSDLRRALAQIAKDRPPGEAKAIWALGLGVREPPGPKYYVNVQSANVNLANPFDLFQHRLWLDPRAGNEWQTVVIPFDAFAAFAQGTVQFSERKMHRDAIASVGISAFVDPPNGVLARRPGAIGSRGLAALRRADASANPVKMDGSQTRTETDEEEPSSGLYKADESLFRPDENTAPQRPKTQTFNFDLGIESAIATGTGSMDELFLLETEYI